MQWIIGASHLIHALSGLLSDVTRFVVLALRSRAALTAENLFLRKQLAFYIERKTRPRRADDATRLVLALLSKLFAWRDALIVVKPETLIGWHRKGFRLFWKWKSKPRGRPRVPRDVRKLMAAMAHENPTWGEERIAAELLLKLGIRVSPRTVRCYVPDDPRPRQRPSSQCWAKFVRNHAQALLACDFFVTVTASFRILYVFVIMEVSTRRIGHFNITAHPTAEWTLQQFREVITGEKTHRFLIHDRDNIYSSELDSALTEMGLRILKAPFRAPQANAFCERLIGSIRRECLDFFIPLNERHLRRILQEWVAHYNRGRPHSSLGPGIPEAGAASIVKGLSEQRIPTGHRVLAKPILGGLHHEYRLERFAA